MIEVIGSSPLYSSRRFREARLPWLGFHSLWQVALRLPRRPFVVRAQIKK